MRHKRAHTLNIKRENQGGNGAGWRKATGTNEKARRRRAKIVAFHSRSAAVEWHEDLHTLHVRELVIKLAKHDFALVLEAFKIDVTWCETLDLG